MRPLQLIALRSSMGIERRIELRAFPALHHARSLRFNQANDPIIANDEIMMPEGSASSDGVNAVGLFRNAGRRIDIAADSISANICKIEKRSVGQFIARGIA